MILVIALNNLQSWLLAKEFLVLDYIQIPWHFLIAPLFYTFLLNYLKIEKLFFNVIRVAFPIFIVSIIFQVICFSFIKDTSTTAEYELFYEKYTAVEELISFIVSISIFFYSFRIIKFKKNLFKGILSYDSLHWLNTFIFLALISYAFWALAVGVKFQLNFQNFIVFFYPLRVMTTVLIYWLGYELVYMLRQVKERKLIREQGLNKTETTPTNYSKKFKDIEEYIINNRRFLDNLLSLETLANELRVSTSLLSKLINEQSSKNFNQLINEYRVEYSKDLLLNDEYSGYTITSIALESGFNSKSTFYNAFKKHTGVTPTQYRS
ncbi:helix-turn-helix domain-containing protein [Tenacibaculum sp. MEBiC06402]|uniref:helix-turn-helix domain-containing protein n=1 Tax=unclassified Tenacibaculum TaxID=2635139 RepID=UPI003B9BCAB8